MPLKTEQWDEIKNEQNKIKYENNIKFNIFLIFISKKEKDYFYYLCNIDGIAFVLLAFLIFL